MSGGVQKRWLSVKSRIIRSYFEKKPRSRKKSKKVKKELSYYNMIKKFICQEKITPPSTFQTETTSGVMWPFTDIKRQLLNLGKKQFQRVRLHKRTGCDTAVIAFIMSAFMRAWCHLPPDLI